MKRYLLLLILAGASVGAHAQTCTTFPCVVSSVTFTNQIHPIATTTIFTPTVSGVFRVNVYVSGGQSTIRDAVWKVFLGWTDDLGFKQSLTSTGRNSSSAANNSGTFLLQSVAGQDVIFRTQSVSGADGSLPYNLRIVVEQLE